MTGDTLMAVPLDRARHVRGGPVPITEGVRRFRAIVGTSAASFGSSANGTLIYILAAADDPAYEPRWLSIATRDGGSRRLPLPPRPYHHPRISPDGSQLAVETEDAKESFISIYDLKGGGSEARRLTFGGHNRLPVWTPDGRWITFQSDREGDYSIFRQLADGTALAERLAKPLSGERYLPESWSPDGKTLTFAEIPPFDARVAALSSGSSSTQRPLGRDLPAEHSAFSPDGRWLAYVSTEIGDRREIFVQPFPSHEGARYQVSTEGGTMPVWARDQKHLYYWANLTRQLVAVDVQTEPTFHAGTKVPLPISGIWSEVGIFSEANYDVLPDGTFIVITPTDRPTRGPSGPPTQAINVVLNWQEELKQRVPMR
jgi:Tol biopolymer transport system component